MAALDPAVANVVDNRYNVDGEDKDDDELIAEIEDEANDHAFSAFRERRLEQLKGEIERAKALKENQHGTYVEIKDEQQLMAITTSTKICVVHFQKPDFTRCRIMDQRLATLAEKHYEVRFVSINVENAPFLVVKLGVKVLPCVIAFKDSVAVDRIVGFEGVGYQADSVTARELEQRLLRTSVLVRAKLESDNSSRPIREARPEEDSADDDWD